LFRELLYGDNWNSLDTDGVDARARSHATAAAAVTCGVDRGGDCRSGPSLPVRERRRTTVAASVVDQSGGGGGAALGSIGALPVGCYRDGRTVGVREK